MKILLIHNHFSKQYTDDTTSVFFETKALLERQGNSVVIFAMSDTSNESSPYSFYFPDAFDRTQMKWFRKLYNFPRSLYNRDAVEKLRVLITDEMPDIVHVFSVEDQITPSIFSLLKEFKIPIVYRISDYRVICPNEKLYSHRKNDTSCVTQNFCKLFLHRSINHSFLESFRGMIKGYVNRFYRFYDYVDLFLAPSIAAQKIYGEYGIPPEKIVVLRNALNLANYHYVFDKSNYILSIGRLSKEKGILTLLSAIHLLAQQDKMDTFTCVIAGHGPQEESLKQFVKENTLQEIVHFVGHCHKDHHQWEDLQKNASASIITLEWPDPAPITVSEAMAFGTPPIVSDAGGAQESITDGEDGLIFETGNSEDLADKIELLITDRSLSQQMRRKARKSVATINDPQIHYDNLMMYYGMMIKRHEKRAKKWVSGS